MNTLKSLLCLAVCLHSSFTYALPADIQPKIDAVMPKVVTWRRDFHQHPELSNQEFRTAEIIADHLRALGMEVQTEVAEAEDGSSGGGGVPVSGRQLDALMTIVRSNFSKQEAYSAIGLLRSIAPLVNDIAEGRSPGSSRTHGGSRRSSLSPSRSLRAASPSSATRSGSTPSALPATPTLTGEVQDKMLTRLLFGSTLTVILDF